MTRKKEDAVSPVIGVMLMLVVTVVIAAVVAVFATGMMEDTEPAPVAKLDVEIISDQVVTGMDWDIYGSGTIPTLHITHVSGDSLNTADLKLTFSWDCDDEDCDIAYGGHHTSTYQYTGEKRWEEDSSLFGQNFDWEYPYAYENYIWIPYAYAGEEISVEPLYINYGSVGGAYFGSHVLKRGDTLIAYDLHYRVVDEVANPGSPIMDALFNNGDIISEFIEGEGYSAGIMECLEQGTAVDVMITHIPSNKVIFEDRVFVE